MARRKNTEITPDMVELAEKLGVDPEQVRELSEIGFNVPDSEPHHRMIVSTSARDKHGKTDWALRTTPEPIALIDMDMGTEGLLERKPFRNRKIIHKVFNLRKRKALEGETMTRAEVMSEWTGVSDCLRTVIQSPIIRTVVVDTGTELWELARLAHLGKLDKVMPHHYGPVNKDFRNIVQLVYERKDLNAVFIHKMKKEYKDDKWKGGYQTAGMSDMPFLVQVNLEHLFDRDEGIFGVHVLNCRQNKDMADEELWGSAGSFRSLGMQVFPDSKKEDWM